MEKCPKCDSGEMELINSELKRCNNCGYEYWV